MHSSGKPLTPLLSFPVDEESQHAPAWQRLALRLAQALWPRQWLRRVRARCELFSLESNSRSERRGIRLLKAALSPSQRLQYEREWHFHVRGGSSGKRYRIRHGCWMNIDELDQDGRRVRGWCFYPRGNLVAGDVMLAQKLALELFETEALRVANKVW